jgi:hypothetical protein
MIHEDQYHDRVWERLQLNVICYRKCFVFLQQEVALSWFLYAQNLQLHY